MVLTGLEWGTDEVFDYTVTGDDGLAVDITSWYFWMTFKRTFRDTDFDAVIQLTSDLGIVKTDAATGKIRLSIGASMWPLSPIFEKTTLVWDIQGRDGNGKIHSLDKGEASIFTRITQSI